MVNEYSFILVVMNVNGLTINMKRKLFCLRIFYMDAVYDFDIFTIQRFLFVGVYECQI